MYKKIGSHVDLHRSDSHYERSSNKIFFVAIRSRALKKSSPVQLHRNTIPKALHKTKKKSVQPGGWTKFKGCGWMQFGHIAILRGEDKMAGLGPSPPSSACPVCGRPPVGLSCRRSSWPPLLDWRPAVTNNATLQVLGRQRGLRHQTISGKI